MPVAGLAPARPEELLPLERLLMRVAGQRVALAISEFLMFGAKETAACVFAGSFLFLLAVSGHVAIPGLSRYDFLFVSAIAIQVVLVTLKLENWREVAVLSLFHLVGSAFLRSGWRWR